MGRGNRELRDLVRRLAPKGLPVDLQYEVDAAPLLAQDPPQLDAQFVEHLRSLPEAAADRCWSPPDGS